MVVSWMSFSVRSRKCLPSSKFVVLHTIPGLVVGCLGICLDRWHKSVTSHCVQHITRGVAIMLLLPSHVRDCQETTSQKILTSTMSVNSTVSTSSMRKPSTKRPKKDVSVSFKQMSDNDTDEGEDQSGKLDNESLDYKEKPQQEKVEQKDKNEGAQEENRDE